MNVGAGNLLARLVMIPNLLVRQGRRHSLQAMLAATICALLCGFRGCNSIADWVRAQEPKFRQLLGF
jgi:hypothetical protein